MPSALKVSVAVTQVVIPGNVESMAVSSVQSMKCALREEETLGRKHRGLHRRRDAGAQKRSSRTHPLPPGASAQSRMARRPRRPRQGHVGMGGGADALSADDPGPEDAANTGPPSCRSKAVTRVCHWSCRRERLGRGVKARERIRLIPRGRRCGTRELGRRPQELLGEGGRRCGWRGGGCHPRCTEWT